MYRKTGIILLILCMAMVSFAGCTSQSSSQGGSSSYQQPLQKMKITKTGDSLTIEIYNGVAVPNDFTVSMAFKDDAGNVKLRQLVKFPTAAPFQSVKQTIPFPSNSTKYDKPVLRVPDPGSEGSYLNLGYTMEE